MLFPFINFHIYIFFNGHICITFVNKEKKLQIPYTKLSEKFPELSFSTLLISPSFVVFFFLPLNSVTLLFEQKEKNFY